MSSRRPGALSGRPLTPKQQRFVEEYLCDLNATQAYLRAGYRAKTNTVARVESSKLLAKPNIQVAIQAARQQLSERTHVDQDMVIQGLYKEATSAASDGARVSAWGHLAARLWPITQQADNRQNIIVRVVYEDRPRIVDGTVIEERKALRDASG